MAWDGWFSYAGVEFINVDRTETYVKAARSSGAFNWFNPSKTPVIGTVGPLFSETYPNAPALSTTAPWFDSDEPGSYGFLGVYPISITGVEDSTFNAPVNESLLDGGLVGRGRSSTRNIVFSVLLLGMNTMAVEYGMRWLRSVLTGGPCVGRADQSCGGADLCYLMDRPVWNPETCSPSNFHKYATATAPAPSLATFQRSLHSVSVAIAPSVSEKMVMSNGNVAWSVQFTLVSGNPFEFTYGTDLITGFLNGTNNPYPGGVTPTGGGYDAVGVYVPSDTLCPSLDYSPVYDPTCGLLIEPPPIPAQDLSCFTPLVDFTRYKVYIPDTVIPIYGDVVPVVTLRSTTTEVRNVRLRFYADVFNTGNPNTDPCNYCGDIMVTYVPQGGTLTIDGTDQRIYIEQPGAGKRRADSLVVLSDGSPMTEWPILTCGTRYIMTVDIPPTQAAPLVNASFYGRVS